jgi:hypothetical protein
VSEWERGQSCEQGDVQRTSWLVAAATRGRKVAQASRADRIRATERNGMAKRARKEARASGGRETA